MSDKPINITVEGSYPIVANMIFDNIGPENCEDILWQNVIDSTSEIEQNEIGVSVTQSYQYTKLNNDPTIMVRWQGIKTTNGNEFRIGLGKGTPGSKQTPPIMSGNMKTGVQVSTDLTILNKEKNEPSVQLGVRKGHLCIKTFDGWRKIKLGDKIL